MFRDAAKNININKVLILSNKNRIADEFKAISSEYRDRLMIGFVPLDAKEVHDAIPDATHRPEVIVLKSYDVEEGKIMDIG